jgi:hypothetical protein
MALIDAAILNIAVGELEIRRGVAAIPVWTIAALD